MGAALECQSRGRPEEVANKSSTARGGNTLGLLLWHGTAPGRAVTPRTASIVIPLMKLLRSTEQAPWGRVFKCGKQVPCYRRRARRWGPPPPCLPGLRLRRRPPAPLAGPAAAPGGAVEPLCPLAVGAGWKRSWEETPLGFFSSSGGGGGGPGGGGGGGRWPNNACCCGMSCCGMNMPLQPMPPAGAAQPAGQPAANGSAAAGTIGRSMPMPAIARRWGYQAVAGTAQGCSNGTAAGGMPPAGG